MVTAGSVQRQLVPGCGDTTSPAKMASLDRSQGNLSVDFAHRSRKIAWRAPVSSTKSNVSSVRGVDGTTAATSGVCRWRMTNAGFRNNRGTITITQLKMCGRPGVVLLKVRRSRWEPRDLGDPGASTNTQTSNKRRGLIRHDQTSLNDHCYDFRVYVMFGSIAGLRIKRYGEALHALSFWISWIAQPCVASLVRSHCGVMDR